MLRNEAQEDKVSGFDVMEIIVNRCHLRDFEDLKQLDNSRNLGGDTTFLIEIFPKTFLIENAQSESIFESPN